MNELFNWGGENPEQRQARLQWEQELLMEQAKVKMMAMMGGAAGGGGVPSRNNGPVPTPGSTDFIIRIDTTLGDGLDSFTVGTSNLFTYNYNVTWSLVDNPGKTGTVTGQTSSATINFPSSGQYDLSISGLFPAHDSSNGNADKLIGIIRWGNNQWESMSGAFAKCNNLSVYLAKDIPDLSNVTVMDEMFRDAYKFNGDVSDWDVSNVTKMRYVFSGAVLFNQPLSNWDVSNVTNMFSMFSNGRVGSTAFNQDISSWNVSNVTDMSFMFQGANSFNQDISNWNVSRVTDMNNMFENATSFNQDLSRWCVTLIPTEPLGFDNNTPAWILPRPVWGTCPGV